MKIYKKNFFLFDFFLVIFVYFIFIAHLYFLLFLRLYHTLSYLPSIISIHVFFVFCLLLLLFYISVWFNIFSTVILSLVSRLYFCYLALIFSESNNDISIIKSATNNGWSLLFTSFQTRYDVGEMLLNYCCFFFLNLYTCHVIKT